MDNNDNNNFDYYNGQQYNSNQQTQNGYQNSYNSEQQYGYNNQYNNGFQTEYYYQAQYSGYPQQPNGIFCPKCGSTNIQLIQEQSTKGKDFSGLKGCCGAILLGPIGILCGSCGKGKQLKTSNYWLCYQCGNKFKV